MSQHNHYSPFLAHVYDAALHIPIRRLRIAIVQIIKKGRADKVIDLCCGTGNQIRYLRKAGIEQAFGVDVSDNMLQQARRKGLKSSCLKMDASNTSFDDDSFDAAIMSFALHEMHAETAQRVFLESKRIVKPTGLLIVADYSFDNHTHPISGFAARTVEKFVGGEHYRNFKYFMNQNLLHKFAEGLQLDVQKRFFKGAVGLWVFINE